MKRWIATMVILLIIIAGVVWEQVYVKQTFDLLTEQLDALLASVAVCGDDTVDTDENKARIADMEHTWRKRERVLCYLVKHTETFQISDSIIYAKNFIEFGNKEETMNALTKLQYLFAVHNYNMGSSLENII